MKSTRLRLMGGAVLGLVLVAGGMTGAAIDRAVSAREPAARNRRDQDECARFRPQRRRGPFDDLNLSAEQQQRVDAVLERRREQLDRNPQARSRRCARWIGLNVPPRTPTFTRESFLRRTR